MLFLGIFLAFGSILLYLCRHNGKYSSLKFHSTYSGEIKIRYNMAKYIKQEMPDMAGTGEKKSYYRMKTEHHFDAEKFVKWMTRYSGIGRGDAMRVLMQASETLAELLAMGISVDIEGLGSFRATVGLKKNKEMDTLDGDEQKRNAMSLQVDGVNFRADKELVKEINRRCELKRGGERRLHKSPYTLEERRQQALQFIEREGFMHVSDYAELTQLSRSSAGRELIAFRKDPASGITTKGRGAAKVYVKAKESMS